MLLLGIAAILISLPAAADGYSTDFNRCPGAPPQYLCTFADAYMAVYTNALMTTLPLYLQVVWQGFLGGRVQKR